VREKSARDIEGEMILKNKPKYNTQKKVIKDKGLLPTVKEVKPLPRPQDKINIYVKGEYVICSMHKKRIKRKFKRRGKEATIALVKELASQHISVSQAEPVNTQENAGE